MASALMTWVWIAFTLAQFSHTESHINAHSRLTGQDEPFDGNQLMFGGAPEIRAKGSFFTPVWNFLRG